MARDTGTQRSLLDRRSYLEMAGNAAAAVSGAAVATGSAAADDGEPTDDASESGDRSPANGNASSGLRGAIYWPARAFNHYQVWAEYNRDEIERDLSYAADLNLDALRVIVGWEFWRDRPDAFRRAFDHFLAAADDRGLQVLPVLFESIGEKPVEKNLADDSVLSAFAVKSPSLTVIENESRWSGPRRFVEWFTKRYGRRDALLALEIMNEPGDLKPRVEFCRAMLRAARDVDPAVPLTMGCKDFEYNRQYADPELDAHQFHYNLPKTAADMERKLREAERFADETGKPVWLTEWQRTRRPQPPDKMLPNYSSLAETIRGSDVDADFFWQLMLKPAYIDEPRKDGRLNGLVHEDGAVYSAGDARAISGERGGWPERRDWPDWAAPAERRWAP